MTPPKKTGDNGVDIHVSSKSLKDLGFWLLKWLPLIALGGGGIYGGTMHWGSPRSAANDMAIIQLKNQMAERTTAAVEMAKMMAVLANDMEHVKKTVDNIDSELRRHRLVRRLFTDTE